MVIGVFYFAAQTVFFSICMGNVAENIIKQIKIETNLFNWRIELVFDKLCIKIHSPLKVYLRYIF